ALTAGGEPVGERRHGGADLGGTAVHATEHAGGRAEPARTHAVGGVLHEARAAAAEGRHGDVGVGEQEQPGAVAGEDPQQADGRAGDVLVVVDDDEVPGGRLGAAVGRVPVPGRTGRRHVPGGEDERGLVHDA